jgi:carboxymethylenebutenolidase
MASEDGETITLGVADGTSMAAYVARPANPNGAAIMVFQEAFGVNGHIRDVTRRFAREGYLSVAPELFHRTAPGFEGNYDDFPSTRPHTSALTNENLERDVRAVYDWITTREQIPEDRIVSIGFCMGGRVSFLANSFVRLAASVSFYGGGIAPGNLDRAEKIRAPMLFVWGGRDKHIGPELIAAVTSAMRTAGRPYVNVEFSHADHGFFCDARKTFHRQAANEAWSLTLSFLNDNLKPAS